jgi:hypothetical protein
LRLFLNGFSTPSWLGCGNCNPQLDVAKGRR